MDLRHLTDKTLLDDLKILVAHERVFLTKILHHLREVDDRKLYCDLNYPSLFEYAVHELGYSEAAASRRIQAARLLKQVPFIEPKIEDGSLTLSNLAKAQRHFNEMNIKDPKEKQKVIKQIENKTTRECEKTLLELSPTQPLPPESVGPVTPTMNQLKVNISDETLALLDEARGLLNSSRIDDTFMNRLTQNALERIKKKKFKLLG